MADHEPSRSERKDSRERHRRSASPPRRHRERHSRSRDRVSRKRDHRSASPKRRRDGSRGDARHRSRSRSRSRDRERKSHKTKRRSRSRSSSDDSERRRKKERKKQKKKEKKAKVQASAAEWGKYGIISEVDMQDKNPEFRTWLIEEKIINPETISKDQIKKLFKEFAEDYNTATLPHEKYYNMHVYEKRMAMVRAGEGNLLEGLDTYDPNADVLAHTKGTKRTVVERESYLSRDQLEELRKVQMEREQMGKMKLLGMNIDSKTGVRMERSYGDQ